MGDSVRLSSNKLTCTNDGWYDDKLGVERILG